MKNFDIPEEDIIEFISQFFVFGEEVEIKFYHYEYYPEDAKDANALIAAADAALFKAKRDHNRVASFK